MELVHEKRLQYASRSIRVLSSIALRSCGLSIDKLTLDRWHDVMKVMRIVDEAADAPEQTRSIEQLVGILETFDEQYPNLSVEKLGGERYAKLIKLAAGTIRLGENLRRASTPAEYIAVREQEASKTADVLLALASDETQQQPNFAKFSPLVHRLTKAVNLIDSAQDAKRDYEDGTLAIPPDPSLRAKLFLKGSQEFIPAIPQLLHPQIAYDFGRMGVQGIRSHQLLRKQRTEQKRRIK